MRKPTITIGICAYNEAASITAVLHALAAQSERNYRLDRVIVISDASTDGTVDAVKAARWKKVSLIIGRSRMGKPARMNMLFKQTKSEILLTIDADVVITDLRFIEKLVRGFDKESVMFISANASPLPGKSLLEIAVGSYYKARELNRSNFDYTKTAFGCRGTAEGFRRPFFQRLYLPLNTINDDSYCYFACQQMAYDYRQIHDARVYFKSPHTISDFLKQHARYTRGGEQILSLFPEEIVKAKSYLPTEYRIRVALYQLLVHPVSYLVFKSMFFVLFARSFGKNTTSLDVRWSMVLSAKPLEAAVLS